MSKETRLQRTVRRAVDRRLEKEQERQKPSTLKPVLKVLIFVIGIPGILVGILQLLPRVSVVPQDPLDARNPFLAPFVISNDGYVTLYNLQSFCFPVYVQLIGIDGKGGQIVLRGTPGYREEDLSMGISSPSFVAAKLPPGNKMTFPCQMALPHDFATNLTVGRAEIAFIVSYHIFGIPWTRHHVNHFSLSRDSTRQFHWLEEPLK
jgi:hypothetical protein